MSNLADLYEQVSEAINEISDATEDMNDRSLVQAGLDRLRVVEAALLKAADEQVWR